MPFRIAKAALFTRIAIGPRLRSTASRAGFSVLRCETSSLSAIAGTPVFSSIASVSRLRSSLRARIATDAPASARPSAIPRPMPPLPPVTTATLPLKSNDFGLAIALLLHGQLDSECSPLLYWRFALVATERHKQRGVETTLRTLGGSMSLANEHIRNGAGTVRPYIFGRLDLLEFVSHVFGAVAE